MVKIEVIPESTGASAFVIADDSLGRGAGSKVCTGGLPTFDAQSQRGQYIEAEEVENLDRQNESTVWPVEVTYCFDTFAESRRFVREIQKLCPRRGAVRFELDGDVSYLVGAWIRPITPVSDYGTTITMRYNISGGKLASSLPVSSSNQVNS